MKAFAGLCSLSLQMWELKDFSQNSSVFHGRAEGLRGVDGTESVAPGIPVYLSLSPLCGGHCYT